MFTYTVYPQKGKGGTVSKEASSTILSQKTNHVALSASAMSMVITSL